MRQLKLPVIHLKSPKKRFEKVTEKSGAVLNIVIRDDFESFIRN